MREKVPTSAAPRRISKRKRFLLFLLVAVALAGAGGTYYFYHQYSALKANPDAAAKQETATLLAEVGKLIELPSGETPTIATISDKSKLSDQAYFKNAANGDKLFIYNAALLAILYRPQANKIINVAPITISQSQQDTNTNAAAAETDGTNTNSATTNTNS